MVGLLVGTKSRKGRNDSQRAMRGARRSLAQAPDSFSSLTNSVTPNSSTADQTPHPRLCLDFSRLESPFPQWAGAQAQRENCSPLAKQTLGSCFPFRFLSPTNVLRQGLLGWLPRVCKRPGRQWAQRGGSGLRRWFQVGQCAPCWWRSNTGSREPETWPKSQAVVHRGGRYQGLGTALGLGIGLLPSGLLG